MRLNLTTRGPERTAFLDTVTTDWQAQPAVQREFLGSFAAYEAFRRAEAEGRTSRVRAADQPRRVAPAASALQPIRTGGPDATATRRASIDARRSAAERDHAARQEWMNDGAVRAEFPRLEDYVAFCCQEAAQPPAGGTAPQGPAGAAAAAGAQPGASTDPRAAWDASPALRMEFAGNFGAYAAYRAAEARGAVKRR